MDSSDQKTLEDLHDQAFDAYLKSKSNSMKRERLREFRRGIFSAMIALGIKRSDEKARQSQLFPKWSK